MMLIKKCEKTFLSKLCKILEKARKNGTINIGRKVMENNENIDFYSYGYEKGLTDENIKRIKKEITSSYGEAAAFDFIAGFIAAQEDEYIKNQYSDYEIKSGGYSHGEEYDDAEMIDGAGKLDYDPYVRNNSFYGGTGVSSVYDRNGYFNEPPVDGKDKSR